LVSRWNSPLTGVNSVPISFNVCLLKWSTGLPLIHVSWIPCLIPAHHPFQITMHPLPLCHLMYRPCRHLPLNPIHRHGPSVTNSPPSNGPLILLFRWATPGVLTQPI
jgi:hypothetical protein